VKKFAFPLERVLAWRRTEARIEEAVLDRIKAELCELDRRRAELERSLREARDGLLQSAFATAPEIAALEHYRANSTAQAAQIAQLRVDLEKKLEHQSRIVAERRRDTRLLERLRERKLEQWRADLSREVEQMAEESHISRMVRALQISDELK
jgi:hypothetical protein